MLLPALYNLALDGRVPERFAIIGFARTESTEEQFRQQAYESVKEFSRRPVEDGLWQQFAGRLYYVYGDYSKAESHAKLASVLERVEHEHDTDGNHLYYLALPPTASEEIIEQMGRTGQVVPHYDHEHDRGGWSRIIVEKPFGDDLETAVQLNRTLHSAFREEDVYRIDHYLGKETVQNILVFRFANGIFEPVWNRRYVDHVQISVAESIGVGPRGGYYEQAGALRDMVQNHIMQLLSLVAMEPPIAFNGSAVRDEKVKVLHALRPLRGDAVRYHTARGQYAPGFVSGTEALGYRQEKGSAPDSLAETFVAVKLYVDNWRWADVPFYIRTGKRLARRSSEIAIQFKQAPLLLFREALDPSGLEPNVLTLRIQPDEGIALKFQTKVPGSPLRVQPVNMDFPYSDSFRLQTPSAYETLILDAIRGDTTLFARADEIEAAWSIVDEIVAGWRDMPPPRFPNYEAGSWGPPEADAMIEADGRRWREP
jgi:glucose-6-phosphate 1-dehydrogenase